MGKIKNRYLILGIACCVQFCYGISYVWTTIQPYAVDYYQVSENEASKAFAILMAFFVIGNLLGGYLIHKISARCLIMLGNVVMSFSIIACAFVDKTNFLMILLLFGCINGMGCGVSYNVLLSEIQSIFLDKKGMATGVMISSAGLFGLVINPIQSFFISAVGVSAAFLYLGLLILIITCGGTLLLSFPKRTKTLCDTNSLVMIFKTKEYYYVSIMMMVAVPVYFLVNPMMLSMSLDHHISYSLALIGVMVASVMNVVGRLLMPMMADAIGSRRMLFLMFLSNIILLVCLIVVKGYVLLVLFSLISFVYGGIMGIFPIINIEFFGRKNNGWNYGLILIGFGMISILCPYLKSMLAKYQQGSEAVFIVSIMLSFIGLCVVKFCLSNRKNVER